MSQFSHSVTATPWSAAHQASLSFIISQSLLKFMSTESMMPSNHLILCCPLLLLPSIFLSIRVFSSELLFASGGQSIGASASASVLSMNIQGCFPLGLTSLISLLSRNSQGSSPTLPFKSSKSQWLYFILITSFKPLPQNTVAFWGTEGFFECEVYTSAK